jgi:chemotaxis protein MotB
MTDEQPIIIIKKKGGHGGHHGGAWKVAYADFVTAMMSLFIVLWLMNSTPKTTQEEIAGYFNDPKGTASKKGSEGKPQPKEESKDKKDDMAALKVDLTKAIDKMSMLNKVKKQIEMTVTEEGLRIELVEDEKGTFFESGSAAATPMLATILKVLASQLSALPNKLSIEGYTDAQPYANGKSYGNWELSADRANTARRVMQENGIHEDQVSQVRGFADQKLHVPDKPFDAANRRVSLLVQNLPKHGGKSAEKAGEKPEDKVSDKAKAEDPKAASPAAEPGTPAAKPSAAEAVVPQKTSGGLLSKAKGLFSHK